MSYEHSSEVLAMIAAARARVEAEAAAEPRIDPNPSYTKTHRVFVWAIMYLAEKPEVIAALKRHYADVCSGGDLCMQEILAFLEQEDHSHVSAANLYESSGLTRKYWTTCMSYLRGTLKNWLDKGVLDSDPLWAD
jgi:hypothetical protein